MKIELRVIALLRDMTRAREIGASTQLARDLGLDGADAEEFMKVYAREFAVDMSAFDFKSHFGPEAGATPVTLLIALFNRRKTDRNPITVGDLIASAQSQKWKSNP